MYLKIVSFTRFALVFSNDCRPSYIESANIYCLSNERVKKMFLSLDCNITTSFSVIIDSSMADLAIAENQHNFDWWTLN